MYVVTGASGHLGALIVSSLVERGVPTGEITGTGRDLGRLSLLTDRGVRTTTVNYDDPSTLTRVLGEGDVLVLVSGSEVGRRVPQHSNVIEAARAVGVGRVLYTSAPHADTSSLILAPEHKATEELLVASGLPYTIARNNWYTENYRQAFDQAAATGVVLSSAGQGRVASAPRADYAAAIAALAVSGGVENSVHELSGDVAWTLDEFAAAASQVLGRPVEHHSVSASEHVAALTSAGLDADTAGFVAALDANIAEGMLADATDEVRRLTGRATESLVQTMGRWVG
jgi:NAD(P)H dehydrogenase (quinone)